MAEVVFGLTAHSVALLLADAAHNCCWHWAAWLGRRHRTGSRTYCYGRSSILASLTNAAVLLVGVGGITVGAVHRLIDGVPAGEADGKTVMIGAAVGIIMNGVTARQVFGASGRCRRNSNCVARDDRSGIAVASSYRGRDRPTSSSCS